MEKTAASGFQKEKSKESKSENDISMHASDKNLQKKVEDVQRYEGYCPRVVSVFRSGERECERELKITIYQFKKWTFLMTAKESKDILKKKLEDNQTEITLKIANACCTVEYFSKQHEKNFEPWVERCSEVTETCFRDLELLSVNGEVEAIQHFSKQKANEDHFISLFEMKGVSGIFLLGRGEHIIDLILASQAYFKNVIIQRAENNENIAYIVFDISSLQCRVMAAFNGIEQTKEKYPYLKVYQSGVNVKMIGNENDCAAASEFLKTNGWMKGVQYERCKQFNGFEFFLKRENVQAFIDGRITKYAGTWAVTKCTEPLNNELVFIYGKTRSDVEGILNVILKSIKIKEFSITSVACTEENIQRWKAYAEKFEQSFGGKFSLQFSTQKDPGLVAYFVLTADLEDEESLKMLVNEIELEIPRKEKIPMEPKNVIWLQKYYFTILKTEAEKNGIDLKFVSKNNVHKVEITGLSTALTEIKNLIHSICPKEQNILLPFASLPSKVTDFLRDCQCCFEYCPFKNSRLWIKGTTGIVVYKGESGTDCLYSDVQVRPVESEGKDMVIEWLNDEKTALLKFPLWREGGTREKNQIEEVLQLLFTEVKKQNKIYVAFDLQNLAFWPMKTCVKSIINCVPKPPEGLIIWISHPDENAFQTAINCLKEAEFTKTGRDIKSSKIELKVVKGRIAKLQEKVDVIVNTTSLSLDMTSGAVSKSILDAAGDELKAEIAHFPVDRTTGQVIRVNYGDVAETLGYRLNCERIFHGALYKWKDDQEKARDVLRQFVKKCICLAEERKFKTLAFPAIGTGQLKIPAILVASSVKSIVEEYAASNDLKHVEKILFVIHEKDEENFKVFRTILEHENAGSTRETPEIPVLYRFSVYGEEQNVVGAMNVLAGLFREHVKEKYKLAMSQEEETKVTNQQKDVHVQPVVKTNGFAISQSPATISTAEENACKFAISYVEQLCLLLQSKEKMVLTEKYLGPVLKDSNCENITCPFLEDECALIKFKTTNDADKFFGSFENEKYALRKLPIQAVTNIKAKLSSKVISVLKGKGITSEEFNRKTGAYLSTDTWMVEGSLLMVQNGERFIKELVFKEYEEVPNFSTQNRNRSANNLDSTSDIDSSRKYSITCSVHEEKALRKLFPSTELPFSNVNIVEVVTGQMMISGTQINVNPFEKALSELQCQEISEISLKEFQDFEKKKFENVSVSFDEKRKAMIIISRSPELLKRSIEEIRRLKDDLLALTEEEFNFIIFFEKSLSEDFPKIAI